ADVERSRGDDDEPDWSAEHDGAERAEHGADGRADDEADRVAEHDAGGFSVDNPADIFIIDVYVKFVFLAGECVDNDAVRFVDLDIVVLPIVDGHIRADDN
ncbi:MAG: hypothetical protein PHW76_09860, partial [Alphaproteobacteria bacterium]|nr:hypothetical protein [Alphaproteobacteria bacterium]